MMAGQTVLGQAGVLQGALAVVQYEMDHHGARWLDPPAKGRSKLSVIMLTQHLIDATGSFALLLSVIALLRPSEQALVKLSGWSSALWTLNNLLIGATMAAALSALSVGRQAGASALRERAGSARRMAVAGLVVATLAIAAVTWSGAESIFPLAGSLTATYAMFHLRGARLRLALVLVNAFWMVNGLVNDAWWQIAANALSGSAAAVGAWRLALVAGGETEQRVAGEPEAGDHFCLAECDCRAAL
jgi:hypothetical protein